MLYTMQFADNSVHRGEHCAHHKLHYSLQPSSVGKVRWTQRAQHSAQCTPSRRWHTLLFFSKNVCFGCTLHRPQTATAISASFWHAHPQLTFMVLRIIREDIIHQK